MKTAFELIQEIGKSLYEGDAALVLLKKWGESIVEQCAESAETINEGNINGEGQHEDYAVVDKDSIRKVKTML